MDYSQLQAEQLGYANNSGYWKCGELCFFDKVECLRHATLTNLNVSYHFFDSAFRAYNWSTPIQKSLDQLYGERAKQLREKYDYVIVAFSGGIDSTNVVDAFLNNNLKIDEIVTYWPISAIEKSLGKFNPADKSSTNLMYEWIMAAQPKLKLLEKNHPEIKITIIDWTVDAIEMVSSDQMRQLAMAGIFMAPILTAHIRVSEMMKKYAEKYKSVACITGEDKPNIMYDPVNKCIGTTFEDFSMVKCKTNLDGYVPMMEYFYQSADFPEIVIAQMQAIGRAFLPMLNSNQYTPEFDAIVDKKKTPQGHIRIQKHTDLVKCILYKNYIPGMLWQADKTKGHFHHDGNSWFYTDLVDERIKDAHDGQLREWLHGIHPRFFEFVDNKPEKFNHIRTIPYWVR